LTIKERSALGAIYGDKGIPTASLRKMVDQLIDDVAKRVYVETLLAKRELEEKASQATEAMVMCYRHMNSAAIQAMLDSKLPGTHIEAAREALRIVKGEEEEATKAAASMIDGGSGAEAGGNDQLASLKAQAGGDDQLASLKAQVGGDDQLASIVALKAEAIRRRELKEHQLEAIHREISGWQYDTLKEAVSDVQDPDVRVLFDNLIELRRPLSGSSSCVPPPPSYEQSQSNYYYSNMYEIVMLAQGFVT
jgi:hypothetical protein